MKIYERSKAHMSRRQAYLESELKASIDQELKEKQDLPHIDGRSAKLIGSRTVQDLMNWQTNKEEKIHRARAKAVQNEIDQMKTPTARTPEGYYSPFTSWQTRAILYWDKKSQTPEKFSHTPKINKSSKNLFKDSSETVEDRLIRYKNEKEDILERKKFDMGQYNQEQKKICQYPDHMYNKGLQILSKKEKAIEECKKCTHRFSPEINTKSRVLATKPRLNKTKPLENQNSHAKSTPKLSTKQLDAFLERNYHAKTEICHTPEPLSPIEKKVYTNKCENLFKLASKNRIKRHEYTNRELLKRFNLERAECTFSPKISRRKIPEPQLIYVPLQRNGYSCKNQTRVHYRDWTGDVHTLSETKLIGNHLLKNIEILEKRVLEFAGNQTIN